jgi:hypothetical protein
MLIAHNKWSYDDICLFMINVPRHNIRSHFHFDTNTQTIQVMSHGIKDHTFHILLPKSVNQKN